MDFGLTSSLLADVMSASPSFTILALLKRDAAPVINSQQPKETQGSGGADRRRRALVDAHFI